LFILPKFLSRHDSNYAGISLGHLDHLLRKETEEIKTGKLLKSTWVERKPWFRQQLQRKIVLVRTFLLRRRFYSFLSTLRF
jgi:hypothetical protein